MKTKLLFIFNLFFIYASSDIMYARKLNDTVKAKTIYYTFNNKNLLNLKIESLKIEEFYYVKRENYSKIKPETVSVSKLKGSGIVSSSYLYKF